MIEDQIRTPHENTDHVALGVLDYLERHPQTADTLDGIIANGLQHRGSLPVAAHVERVLVRLVELGVLRREPCPEGSALYALSAALSVRRAH